MFMYEGSASRKQGLMKQPSFFYEESMSEKQGIQEQQCFCVRVHISEAGNICRNTVAVFLYKEST
jgi:hypothetical protein